jgi:hypothetical protein
VTYTVKVCVVTLLCPYTVAYYTVRFYRHKFGEKFKPRHGIVGPDNVHVNNYMYQMCTMAVLDIMLCTLI